MTLASWENKGWLRKSHTHKQEILDLLSSAECDLMDARRDLSPEWCFGLAFASVVNLCTIFLNASGYRADNEPYLRAIHVLPLIFGEGRKADADYLENCFMLCKQKNSDQSVTITLLQASELVRFVEDLFLETCEWLRSTKPALIESRAVVPDWAPEQGLVL